LLALFRLIIHASKLAAAALPAVVVIYALATQVWVLNAIATAAVALIQEAGHHAGKVSQHARVAKQIRMWIIALQIMSGKCPANAIHVRLQEHIQITVRAPQEFILLELICHLYQEVKNVLTSILRTALLVVKYAVVGLARLRRAQVMVLPEVAQLGKLVINQIHVVLNVKQHLPLPPQPLLPPQQRSALQAPAVTLRTILSWAEEAV